CEGCAESLLGGVNLLIEELPADLVLPGQLGDRFSPGEHLDGQPLPLLRRQLLSRTRNVNSCRSWPVKRSRSRSGITLRDRDRQSSLTIHVCFLHETQFVRTNNANMEEAGILEKITRSGFCYPALNQVENRSRPDWCRHPCSHQCLEQRRRPTSGRCCGRTGGVGEACRTRTACPFRAARG